MPATAFRTSLAVLVLLFADGARAAFCNNIVAQPLAFGAYDPLG